MTKNQIKMLLGKIGLDGHDRGVRLLSAWLRNSGIEVIYIGTHNTPESVAAAASEEDVDIIGLSFQGADHIDLTKAMKEEIKKAELDHVMLIVGGNIPRKDVPVLKDMGVDEVFLPGTMMESIVDYIKQNAGKGVKNTE